MEEPTLIARVDGSTQKVHFAGLGGATNSNVMSRKVELVIPMGDTL